MKKLLLIAFILVFLLPLNVKAGEMDSYVDYELVDKIYAHRIINGEQRKASKLAMFSVNGKTAYCIEPGVIADKDSYYNSTENIDMTPISYANKNRLSLIGYYGYGYSNHNSIEYYMATQELLWRELGVSDMWWTDSKDGGNTLNIEQYKSEILNLVNRYELLPNFILENDYIIGQKVVIPDINEVLMDFDIISENDFKIEGNSVVGVLNGENSSFKIRRKADIKLPVFYYKTGYQTIGVFEGVYSIEKEYQINALYGSVTLNKLDYDTKSNKPIIDTISLKNAEYGLFDTDMNLIKKEVTNEYGKIIFDGLKYGTYYIKEIKPSTGYNIDEKIYEINITNENYEISVDSYEKVIENEVIITKYLDDENNNTCNYEKGVIFRMYDVNNNIIDEKETNENGQAKFVLPYGKYVLKQITTSPNSDFADDRIITVDSSNNTYEYTIYNHRKKMKEELPIDILPNTAKSIYRYYLITILMILGILYEKKVY